MSRKDQHRRFSLGDSLAFYAPSLQICPAESLDFTPGKGELRGAKTGHLGLKELAHAAWA